MEVDMEDVDGQLQALAGPPRDTRRLVRAAGAYGLTLARVDAWLEDLARGVVPHRTFSSPAPPRPRFRPTPLPPPPSPIAEAEALGIDAPPPASAPPAPAPSARTSTSPIPEPPVVSSAPAPRLTPEPEPAVSAGAPVPAREPASEPPAQQVSGAPDADEQAAADAGEPPTVGVVGQDGTGDEEPDTTPASEIDRLLAMDDEFVAEAQAARERAHKSGRPGRDTVEDRPDGTASGGFDDHELDAILNSDFTDEPGTIEVDLAPESPAAGRGSRPASAANGRGVDEGHTNGKSAAPPRARASTPPPLPARASSSAPASAAAPAAHDSDFEMLADDDVLELDDDELELLE